MGCKGSWVRIPLARLRESRGLSLGSLALGIPRPSEVSRSGYQGRVSARPASADSHSHSRLPRSRRGDSGETLLLTLRSRADARWEPRAFTMCRESPLLPPPPYESKCAQRCSNARRAEVTPPHGEGRRTLLQSCGELSRQQSLGRSWQASLLSAKVPDLSLPALVRHPRRRTRPRAVGRRRPPRER